MSPGPTMGTLLGPTVCCFRFNTPPAISIRWLKWGSDALTVCPPSADPLLFYMEIRYSSFVHIKGNLKKELTINEGVVAEGKEAGGYESESFVINLNVGEINQNV